MKYNVFILLLVCISPHAFAQNIEQITRNNVADRHPTVYGDKIAWVSAPYRSPGEILMLEGDSIRQITFNSESEHTPLLGPGYLVWIQYQTGGHAGDGKVMLYDGKTIKEISATSTENRSLRAYGTFITWDGINEKGELWSYVYNGAKLTPLVGNGTEWRTNFHNAVIGLGDGLVYYIMGDSLGRCWLLSYDGSQSKVIASYVKDTLAFGPVLFGEKSIYYCVRGSNFEECYYYHTNGTFKKGPKLWGHYPYFNDSTLAWTEYHGMDDGSLWIWDLDSVYKIAEYPFDALSPGILPNRPAVFPFYHRITENMGWQEPLTFFNGKDIYGLCPPGKGVGRTPILTSNKVVWTMHDVGQSEYRSSSELFILTFEPFKNPASQKNSNVRVYYKPISQKIHFEILSPEMEQYDWVVFDLLGRRILQGNFHSNIGTKEVDAGPLSEAPGIYLVFISSDDRSTQSTTKIFIGQ